MDYSADSYLSSCPGNSAFESYSFLDDSAESYGEGSILPSSYFMRATSDHNLKFSDHEKNPNTLTSGCLPYNVQSDLLSGDILSKDKLPNSLPMLQQLQNCGDLQNNFIVPGVLECNATPGTFCPQLDTPVHSELPHAFSSSIDGNGGEISGFLADVHAVSSAPTMCSTFQRVSSFMESVKLEAFSFEGAENAAILSRTGNPNGSLSVIDSATLASLHDQNEFINGSLASVPTGQQTQVANGGSKIRQQVQSVIHNLHVPTFISGTQMAFTEAQGTLIPPKMPPQIHDNKNECPIIHSSDVQPQANSAHGNGASMKPRIRARRGQATDPHSIAERLRREKISDRMKNLQDLVPNSNKADKASMLDEIIDYVKFLQLQVKVLSMSRLGATGAVLPLLAESQTESCSGLLISAPTNGQGLLDLPDSEDSHSFEQEVAKLMETSITSAMQYLQNKGLCLMPIALASAISNQKGTAAAAIPPERRNAGSNWRETIVEDGTNSCALDSINCVRELKHRA